MPGLLFVSAGNPLDIATPKPQISALCNRRYRSGERLTGSEITAWPSTSQAESAIGWALQQPEGLVVARCQVAVLCALAADIAGLSRRRISDRFDVVLYRCESGNDRVRLWDLHLSFFVS